MAAKSISMVTPSVSLVASPPLRRFLRPLQRFLRLLSLLFDGAPSGSYFTRAKKAWFIGKCVGLVFNGSDLEALHGLEKELRKTDSFRACC